VGRLLSNTSPRQPVQVSAEQIATFARLYRNNARPIQPTFGRLIKESR